MKRGLSASSPSACRNLRIAVFTPTSKSTKVSAGQSFCCSSSRVTKRPAFDTSSSKTLKGCSWSLMRTPFLRNSPSRSESSNDPNRNMRSRCDENSVVIWCRSLRIQLHLCTSRPWLLGAVTLPKRGWFNRHISLLLAGSPTGTPSIPATSRPNLDRN
jgi:hypothetical protein